MIVPEWSAASSRNNSVMITHLRGWCQGINQGACETGLCGKLLIFSEFGAMVVLGSKGNSSPIILVVRFTIDDLPLEPDAFAGGQGQSHA